jgi:pantoate--beta-alanine ligase
MTEESANLSDLYTDLSTWITKRRTLKREGLTLGFVPTMGALHAGHGSLLERARKENDVVVLSIYVNPTQFDNKDDLKKYPITLDRDRETASKSGVDFILLPDYKQMYPDDYRYKISEKGLSEKLCGAHRPGHFDGVLTVVMKLLNLVQADRAYFGEKDFQQLQLVQGMAEAFFLDTEIVPCPTVREADGLAMSSRNLNLPTEARERAPLFYKAMREAATASDARMKLANAKFEVDYIEDIGTRRYGAVKIGGVRLIDNVEK